MEGGTQTIRPAELFDALANERRRSCVRHLGTMEPPVAVDDLATRVAADIADDDADSMRQSIYISLIQSHLPKLDDYHIVAYDDETKTVALDAAFDETYHCLRTHGDGRRPFDGHTQLLAVSVVTAIALIGALLFTALQTYLLVALVAVHAVALVVIRT